MCPQVHRQKAGLVVWALCWRDFCPLEAQRGREMALPNGGRSCLFMGRVLRLQPSGGRGCGGCFLHTLSTLVLSFHRSTQSASVLRKAVASLTPVTGRPCRTSWVQVLGVFDMVSSREHTLRTLSTLHGEALLLSCCLTACLPARVVS